VTYFQILTLGARGGAGIFEMLVYYYYARYTFGKTECHFLNESARKSWFCYKIRGQKVVLLSALGAVT